MTIGVAHDPNLATQFADRLMLLDRGKVLADGKQEEVLTETNLQAAFGVKPAFMTNPKNGRTYLVFD